MRAATACGTSKGRCQTPDASCFTGHLIALVVEQSTRDSPQRDFSSFPGDIPAFTLPPLTQSSRTVSRRGGGGGRRCPKGKETCPKMMVKWWWGGVVLCCGRNYLVGGGGGGGGGGLIVL